MRYGIFSDVHGNIEALQVVLDHLRSENVDKLAFLGDAVGYGANPDEVCDAIRAATHVAIVGNHDAAVVGRMDYSEYYDAARHALDWCSERLSDQNKEWLKNLPYQQRDGEVLFSHGAPLAPELFDYLFAPEQVLDMLDAYDDLAPVTFIGHSHLTLSFKIEPDRVTPIIQPNIECDPQSKYIITVGSVGQPRDRDPRSCCGIYDTSTRVFEYVRQQYDVLAARQKILDAGLSPMFGERLLVGM
jgi:diadenosine tetraphosphatase ApaH/serine/threonine PP2A family protein phosphatase